MLYQKQLEKLVGRRFNTLEDLKMYIIGEMKLPLSTLIFSESDKLPENDLMIDGEFIVDGEYDGFTIFYLFDNAKNIYITEV